MREDMEVDDMDHVYLYFTWLAINNRTKEVQEVEEYNNDYEVDN